MPYTLSPSILSLLDDCPRCFWLAINKDIKRPRGIFPSLPSGMDHVLKTYFDEFRAKNKVPPVLATLQGVKLYPDQEQLKKWRFARKGLWWEDKEGNVLHGGVDELLQKGSTIIVLDYKTRGFGLKDVEEYVAHYQGQLNIYNFLLRKLGHATEDYAYLLIYHPDKVLESGEIAFHADLQKVTINVKNAETLFKKALKVLKGKEPKPSKDCEYCEYCAARK